VADIFTARVNIPFLHIVDPTAAAIRRAGFKRVGLLGTKTVMAQDFIKQRYLDKFGIEVLVPGESEQEMVDRTIFDELCRGVFRPETKASYLALADELASRGAQGVILGCTEIPLLLTQEDRPGLPFFNTAALHVDAALELATPSLQPA
jgi:aspartate racemase